MHPDQPVLHPTPQCRQIWRRRCRRRHRRPPPVKASLRAPTRVRRPRRRCIGARGPLQPRHHGTRLRERNRAGSRIPPKLLTYNYCAHTEGSRREGGHRGQSGRRRVSGRRGRGGHRRRGGGRRERAWEPPQRKRIRSRIIQATKKSHRRWRRDIFETSL